MTRLLPLILGALPVLATSAATAQEPSPAAPSVAAEGGARVSLSPLRIEMDGPEIAATLRVYNPSQVEAIGIQMRAFDWSQADGQDVYAPTGDVRITPAIITIEPGKTQVFRIIRREAAPASETVQNQSSVPASAGQSRASRNTPAFTIAAECR